MIRSTAVAAVLAIVALPAGAATINYGFEGGSLSFGISPSIATVTGTFAFDTNLGRPVSSDLTISDAGSRDGLYSVLDPTGLNTRIVSLFPDGTNPLGDLTGVKVFQFIADGTFANGGTVPLFEIALLDCGNASCNQRNFSDFQASIMNDPVGNVVELPPVPLPATLPMLLGAFWARRLGPATEGLTRSLVSAARPPSCTARMPTEVFEEGLDRCDVARAFPLRSAEGL